MENRVKPLFYKEMLTSRIKNMLNKNQSIKNIKLQIIITCYSERI